MSIWKCYYAAKDGKYDCKEIDEKEKPEAYLYKFKNNKFEKLKGYLIGDSKYYCTFFSCDDFGHYKKYSVPVHECRVYNNAFWLSIDADGVALDIFLANKELEKKCILECLEKCNKSIEILNELKGKIKE